MSDVSALLVLLVLLVLFSVAKAKCPLALPEQRPVTIAATTSTIKSSRSTPAWIYLHSSWGENVSIFCTSDDAANLTIARRKEKLPVEKLYTRQLNSTTIELTQMENIGKYEYYCLDSKTECIDSLTLYVEPAMTVVSLRGHDLPRDGEIRQYYVPRGEEYHVICSGDKGLLRIKSSTNQILETNKIHEFQVKHSVKTHRRGDRTYWCSAGRFVNQGARVNVDFYPEGRNFRCILFFWDKLECAWSSSSVEHTFNLFYTDSQNNTPIFLCADQAGNKNRSCGFKNRLRWRPLIVNDQNFFLTLKTCNDVFCNNQTFPMYSNSITKLDSVTDFKVLSTSSSGAVLTWHDPALKYTAWSCKTCVYKVEYRLVAFGEDWRQVNATSAQCIRSNTSNCEFQLDLPYPGSEYEARVCVRFKESTDSIWSEPASITSIFTNPRKVECSCNAQQEPSTISKQVSNVVSCQVCESKENFIKHNLAFKDRIIALRRKLAKLKKYAKLLKAIDSLF